MLWSNTRRETTVNEPTRDLRTFCLVVFMAIFAIAMAIAMSRV
jgi:hypothetical protein